MKRFFAVLLTLALALGTVVTPGWATEQRGPDGLSLEDAKEKMYAAFLAADYDDDAYWQYSNGYWQGWYEGEAEGDALGRADQEAGKPYDPAYTPPEERFSTGYQEGKTYEDGYAEGYDEGMRYAYYNGYYAKYYNSGYAAGETQAQKDHADGSWETVTLNPPVEDSTKANFEYAKGYFWGYLYALQDLAHDEGYPIGYALGQADSKADVYANESQYPYLSEDEIGYVKYYHAMGLYYGQGEGYRDAWTEHWIAEAQAERNAKITTLGGAPGQINVRLNDKMIPFSDAFPEFRNERTMLPVRALMEAIDAAVTWDEDSQTVTIAQEDGFTLAITVGSDKATLTTGGETQTLTLDAPAYEKDGRVYVPLRLIGEALGYGVYWDESYQTVVLLDSAAVIAGIDESFTAYNGFMEAHKIDLETRKQITDSLNLTVELLDSIDGNRSFAFPARAETHLGDGGLTMEGYLDLGKLKELVLLYAQDLGESYWPEWLDLVSAKQEFACKLTPEGVLYVHCPLFDQAMALGSGVASGSFATWYKIDLNLIYPNWKALLELDSMGEMAYWTTLLMSYGDPIDYYDEITAAAAAYESLLSDEAFTRAGGEYRMKMDLEDLIAINLASLGEYDAEYGEYMAESMRETFSIFNFDLRFKPNGSYTISAQIKMQMGYLGSVINMVQNASGSTAGSEQSALFQVKNFLNVTMKESVTIRTSDQAPNFELPAGVKVIDLLGGEAEPLEEYVASMLGQPFMDAAAKVFAQLQTAQF